MTPRGWLVLLLLAIAAPAFAQDRPPAAPPDLDGATCPPDRPAFVPASDVLPPGDTAAASASPTGAEDTGAEMYGPPPPPIWFTLAEDDPSFAACRLALSLLGTHYRIEPPLTDLEDRDCGIARPLRVSQIIPGVALTGNPVLRCDTARALGFWTRDFLRPAAALLPGAPRLEALETGQAYACRDRIGTGAARPKPSEHSFGNAIDVMGFRLSGRDPMPVVPRAGDGDEAEGFLRAARGTACLLFTTVLGPGANEAHDDHLHLDMAARNGGWRLCE